MDRRGVTGPFEDLPSLLIVIVATGLFLSVAARAVVLQQEAGDASWREERAWRLLREAMTMDCIMEGEGRVDLQEAGMASEGDILSALGWLDGGWRINITWTEDGFARWLEWSSGEPEGERATAQASVVVDAGSLAPGRMTAVVWDG